jgi:hypothetical protein
MDEANEWTIQLSFYGHSKVRTNFLDLVSIAAIEKEKEP